MRNPLFRLMDRLDAINTKLDQKIGAWYRIKYHGIAKYSYEGREKATRGAQLWAEAHPDDPFTEIERSIDGRWEPAGSAHRSESDGKIHVTIYR